MRKRPWKHTAHLACALAVLPSASGCHLDKRGIAGVGDVAPARFCPGDTLRASYDLLRGETCPVGVDCSPHFPAVAVSSTPESFAPALFRAYAGGLDFVPAADSVAVTFDIDRERVLIPTDRFEDGSRVFIERAPVSGRTITATRIAPFSSELVHDGMCAGASPVNAPAMLPGPPTFSPNLLLQSLCNANPVAVAVTLTGTAGGYTQNLSPGECLRADAPGVPSIDAGTAVNVARLVPDPGARCSAAGPNSPPAPLRTVAHMDCR
jgi:hypothetical protein